MYPWFPEVPLLRLAQISQGSLVCATVSFRSPCAGTSDHLPPPPHLPQHKVPLLVPPCVQLSAGWRWCCAPPSQAGWVPHIGVVLCSPVPGWPGPQEALGPSSWGGSAVLSHPRLAGSPRGTGSLILGWCYAPLSRAGQVPERHWVPHLGGGAMLPHPGLAQSPRGTGSLILGWCCAPLSQAGRRPREALGPSSWGGAVLPCPGLARSLRGWVLNLRGGGIGSRSP